MNIQLRHIGIAATAFFCVMVIAACGYFRVFKGSEDDKITWTQSVGYKTETEVVEAIESCVGTLAVASLTFAEGDKASSVTQNFTVPQRLGDCDVGWSANSEASAWITILEGVAIVTRPTGSNDETVTLTASLSVGETFETKTVVVTIKRQGAVTDTGTNSGTNSGTNNNNNNTSDVSTCKTNLTTSRFTFASGDSTTAVTQNFTVPVTQNSCSVEWTASNSTWITGINSSTGVVTVARQSAIADQTVTLTATLNHSSSGTSDTKSFNVTIVRQQTDGEAVALCKANLTSGGITFGTGDTSTTVTQNFTLPLAQNDCTVSWTGDNSTWIPSFNPSTGVATVARQSSLANQTVTLTATISRNVYSGASDTKTFNVTVLRLLADSEIDACAAAVDVSDITFTGSDTSAGVTQNFSLPSTISAGGNTCALTWSENPNSSAVVISGTSVSVTRPAYTSANASVNLKATASAGTGYSRESASVGFVVTKLPPTDLQKANECQAGFTTSNITFTSPDIASSVTKNFSLPANATISGNSCAFSSWSSNDSSISVSGTSATVSRPADTGSNASVTISGTVSVNGVAADNPVTANLTVIKYTEAEIITACSTGLTVDDFTGVTKQSNTAGTIANTINAMTVPLSESGVGGLSCSITWSSNNTTYLSLSGGNGTVNHFYDGSDTIVTLTATLTRGSTNATKNFSMTVKSKLSPPVSRTTVAFSAGSYSSINVAFAASSAIAPATILYKICVSNDEDKLANASSMDAMSSNCLTSNMAYPSIESPLNIPINGGSGETWFARVYSIVDGEPNTDSKKILYNKSEGLYFP